MFTSQFLSWSTMVSISTVLLTLSIAQLSRQSSEQEMGSEVEQIKDICEQMDSLQGCWVHERDRHHILVNFCTPNTSALFHFSYKDISHQLVEDASSLNPLCFDDSPLESLVSSFHAYRPLTVLCLIFCILVLPLVPDSSPLYLLTRLLLLPLLLAGCPPGRPPLKARSRLSMLLYSPQPEGSSRTTHQENRKSSKYRRRGKN